MSWHEQVIAVTGSIGSGKSTAVNFLKDKGAFVVSADELARQVVAPGSPGLKRLVASFGEEVLNSDGTLDRHKLGELIFADDDKRKELEGVLHPLIADLAAKIFEDAINRGERFLVYEVPLLFEAGLDALGFKKIIVVTAPDDVCFERMRARDNFSESDARRRLAAQLPREEKAKRADIVIDNSGDLNTLNAQLSRMLQGLDPK